MKRPALSSLALLLSTLSAPASMELPSDLIPPHRVDTAAEPTAPGPFRPEWSSLAGYGAAPDWFRDAKFGIWAHWGPQCQPEAGDWYARHAYVQGHPSYETHLVRYGHPSKAGFKEVIHAWKAERWDPDALVELYRRCGARYFFAMANHHDNLDLWASRHHPWNSVRVGPGKDLIAGWAAAARRAGLPFGVSVHSAHAWLWYEPAQGADQNGPLAGVPYDGRLTLADGRGQWWEGLDPRKLYAQDHTPSPGFENAGAIHARWNWGAGASVPDAAYCQDFHDRTVDLIRRYQPELIYFDDTALPLWPVSDAGLRVAAHFYNQNLALSEGRSAGVLLGKILAPDQKTALVWDIEKGVPPDTQAQPWQTDTCLGGWHYDRDVYTRDRYKSAATVIRMLADIVSKNGNLLLNVPVRGDGTIDEKETAIVEAIGAWLAVHGEAIYGTRPWRVFGEGPASAGAALSAQGFNEGKGRPFTGEDVRYTAAQDGRTLYVIALGVPAAPLRLAALGLQPAASHVTAVSLLGSAAPVRWEQTETHLVLNLPAGEATSDAAVVFKLSLRPSPPGL